ncbi:MAG: GxxExxY protein [Candidatus Sungbacteria bacterium]|nr:GxxExxY protein [Candidatus Sungbacteria bacterium]
MAKPTLKRQDILYPEESYKIIGILFDVYNYLGPGHHEKYYQRAVSYELEQRGVNFKEQLFVPVWYRGKPIGRQYFDFLVDGKIVLELKKGNRFSKRHIDQVLEYLKSGDYRLAIIANFGSDGIAFRRIINFK